MQYWDKHAGNTQSKSDIPAQLHYHNKPGHHPPGNGAPTRMRLHSSLLPGRFYNTREQQTKPGLTAPRPAAFGCGTNEARLHPCQPARKAAVQSSRGIGTKRGVVNPEKRCSSLQPARLASREEPGR